MGTQPSASLLQALLAVGFSQEEMERIRGMLVGMDADIVRVGAGGGGGGGSGPSMDACSQRSPGLCMPGRHLPRTQRRPRQQPAGSPSYSPGA